MEEDRKENFNILTCQRILNRSIENNNDFLLNKNFTYEFISRQINSKKMYFKDNKKQLLCLFEM